VGWRPTHGGERFHQNHGGEIHGFGTQVFFNKPTRAGAILLINMWPTHGGMDLAQEILELILAAD
jgi:hypothetical protein